MFLRQTDKQQIFACTMSKQLTGGLRKIAWASVFRFLFDVSMFMSPCLHGSMAPCLCLHISGIPQTEKGTNGKWQPPFDFCKRKTETTNVRLFDANENGKQTFVPWSANDKG
jgi:hypothetical protein